MTEHLSLVHKHGRMEGKQLPRPDGPLNKERKHVEKKIIINLAAHRNHFAWNFMYVCMYSLVEGLHGSRLTSPIWIMFETMFLWVSRTPFGNPVVPEEYNRKASSSEFTFTYSAIKLNSFSFFLGDQTAFHVTRCVCSFVLLTWYPFLQFYILFWRYTLHTLSLFEGQKINAR